MRFEIVILFWFVWAMCDGRPDKKYSNPHANDDKHGEDTFKLWNKLLQHAHILYDCILYQSQDSVQEIRNIEITYSRYAPMGSGSIHSPGAVCVFGFQSILTSAGFLRVLRFSLQHLKLDFLNKYSPPVFRPAS